jgi:alkanesulfonate monooxygenase SsuD/methylene tetrahydromethanopterin reductase-like flavin-dependent oxidoreductase (luciferase family)
VRQASVGVHFSPLESRWDVVLELAALADRLGYAAVTLGEAWGRDGFLGLAEVAARTERVRLVPTVISVWSRTPATLAMAAATLQEQSGGRAVLGLGASSRALTEGFHDVAYEAPLERLRTAVEQSRALLSGERVPLTREARPLRLGMPATPATPIYLGTLSPRALRLTGELGDGWLPYLVPAARLSEFVAEIDRGRARRPAGLGERIAIAPSIPTLVSPDGADARAWVARMLTTYVLLMGEFYGPFVTRLGYGRELEAIRAANSRAGDGIVPAEAERLLSDETIYGDPDTARRALARWVDAGADEPLLLMPPGAPVELMRLTLETFAPER